MIAVFLAILIRIKISTRYFDDTDNTRNPYYQYLHTLMGSLKAAEKVFWLAVSSVEYSGTMKAACLGKSSAY